MDKSKRLLCVLLALALVCGGGLFLSRSGFFAACTSPQALQSYINNCAPYSHLAFFLIQFLSVVLAPIPSNISAAAGGVLFGTWTAFFITLLAVMLGSVLVFWLARTLGRGFSDRFVSRHLSEKYRQVIHAKTSAFLALAFLLPYFPDDVLCILAGLSAISFHRFAIIALLTRPWGLLFACALGGASLSVAPWVLVLIGLCGGALFVLGLRYAQRLELAILTWLGRNHTP